jgi:hypothetical protein
MKNMRNSSRLTRLIIYDWLKGNLVAALLLPCILVAITIFIFNPIVGFSEETALVIRSQQVPSKWEAAPSISFIKTANGKISTITTPTGVIPPAQGITIKVRRLTHLLKNESYIWMK